MKKIWILTLFLLTFFLNSNTSIAASNLDIADEKPATQESRELKYELPYPGLLPDNPIYFLRMARDKIVSFLISDPLKKAEFNLLQADKRLNAGVYLVAKHKIALALSTVSKAENYFEEALQKTKEAQKQGMETKGIGKRLVNSSKKHQEVLMSLAQKSPKDFKADFESQLKRVIKFEKEAIALTSK